MSDERGPEESFRERMATLKEMLGERFVSWFFGDVEHPSNQQIAAMEWVRANAWIDRREEVLAWGGLLTSPTESPSVVQQLRNHMGADSDSVGIDCSRSDPLEQALCSLSVDSFGGLLIREHTGFVLSSGYGSSAYRAAVSAIRNDPELPFSEGESEMDPLYMSLSIGSAGTLQLATMPMSMMHAAWNMATVKTREPSVEDLIDELPGVIAGARQGFTRSKMPAVGVAALSGVVPPPGVSLVLPWGILRSAHGGEHPWQPPNLGLNSVQTFQGEDGRVVSIHDRGDVIMATDLTVSCRYFRIPAGHEGKLPSSGTKAAEILAERIEIARLAFLLAWGDEAPPVLVPAWSKTLVPMRPGDSWGVSDLSQYAFRTPTEVTPDFMSEWSKWIHRLAGVTFRRISLASQRLLRASAERRDPQDALVDAVIAWESLFGSESEISFKISASLALLICDEGSERVKFRKRASDIYSMRSRLVHGAEVNASQVADASREAIKIGRQALRAMVLDRPDLVEMTSAERAIALILR
ncbi:hypothetical protein ACFT0G_12100 [Streptomyces sp. NPDC057020]|uniref:hypothetical protein n=1 Tax=unclassified Streptomyces TaxID=2593676 RepID=UPI00363512A2